MRAAERALPHAEAIGGVVDEAERRRSGPGRAAAAGGARMTSAGASAAAASTPPSAPAHERQAGTARGHQTRVMASASWRPAASVPSPASRSATGRGRSSP